VKNSDDKNVLLGTEVNAVTKTDLSKLKKITAEVQDNTSQYPAYYVTYMRIFTDPLSAETFSGNFSDLGRSCKNLQKTNYTDKNQYFRTFGHNVHVAFTQPYKITTIERDMSITDLIFEIGDNQEIKDVSFKTSDDLFYQFQNCDENVLEMYNKKFPKVKR
jgi:hypothetical protein